MSPTKTTAKEYFDFGMAAFARADLIAATEDFQACVDRDPKNPEAWYYLGMSALPRDFNCARDALDRAIDLSPGHLGALYWRAETDWLAGQPGAAVKFLQQLNELAPDSPQNLFRLGLALLDAGKQNEGEDTLQKAVDAGSGVAGVSAYHPELRRAIYLDLLGQHDESARLVQSINGSGVSPDLSAQRYPLDLEVQRCNLENVVAGRDIVILGSGPSLAKLPELLKSMDERSRDNLCFFGFNNVPVAERMLLETIGRPIDLACMTSASVMVLHQTWIADFLNRTSSPNLFLTLTASLPPDGIIAKKLAEKPEKSFYFAASGDYPPIPEDPLHFPPINTLICVLPLAVLAQPRRIFLFGCDGVASVTGDNAPVYFRQGSEDYGNQAPPPPTYPTWLARDTYFFNALIPTVLHSFSVLHRVQVPPILTCNPDSAYRPFPRISTQDFLQMQADTAVIEPLFPARINQLQRQMDKLQAQLAAKATMKGPVNVLKKQTGELWWQAGRVKRFAKARIMALLRGLR